MYERTIRARKSAASPEVHAGGQPPLDQVGGQHVGDALPDPVALHGQGREQRVRLGLHHPLEDLVLDDRAVGEHDAPLHHLLEVRRPLDALVELGEEVETRPRRRWRR